MDRIKFQNYKAFENGEIELRPLTLLLGANSSGKSSILHLLLMLEQTINCKDDLKSAFKANGHSVSMGEDINLLKDMNRQSSMVLEIDVPPSSFISEIKTFHGLLNQSSILGFMNNLKYNFPKDFKIFEKASREWMEQITKSENNKSVDIAKTYLEIVSKDNDNLLSYLLETEVAKQKVRNEWWKKYTVDELSQMISDLGACFKTFEEEFKESPSVVSLKYILSYNKTQRKLKVKECSISVGDRELLAISLYRNKLIVTSKVYDNVCIERLVGPSSFSGIFNGLSLNILNDMKSPFEVYIEKIFNEAFKSATHFFSETNINYIGPLRATPQRYYFLDGTNTISTFGYRSGERIAEILKGSKDIDNMVNEWMKRFGLNVKVKEFKDVIHKIKVRQNSLDLDLPDVGFGVSQILPILIDGVLFGDDTTTIMEQPEIHLHPKMQAELADFFINVVKRNNNDTKKTTRRYVIETHSEYIMKRIRRRIAEGVIAPEDVAIYFVEPRNKKLKIEARINRTIVENDGTIEWPKDFYMTELEDEMAFFQFKMNKS